MAKVDNLQGALELLVMKILRRGPNHGFAISSYIQQTSDEILRVEAGSLYPALHRMTEAGLLKAEWRMSEAGRRARFYGLTAKGRRKLEAEEKRWHAISCRRAKILGTSIRGEAGTWSRLRKTFAATGIAPKSGRASVPSRHGPAGGRGDWRDAVAPGT
jgi:transcriptional regulator